MKGRNMFTMRKMISPGIGYGKRKNRTLAGGSGFSRRKERRDKA
jgi:hypothetical protein